MANTRDYGKFKKRRGYEDGGEVKGGDDWYKQGWKYWDDKYKEVGPKPQAFDAEKQNAITQGLSKED